MNRCPYQCVNKHAIDHHLSIGICIGVLNKCSFRLERCDWSYFRLFVHRPSIIHQLNKVYKSGVVDELLLVYCDNVCIQTFSVASCGTFSLIFTSKPASTLGTGKKKKDFKRQKARRGGGGKRGMVEVGMENGLLSPSPHPPSGSFNLGAYYVR